MSVHPGRGIPLLSLFLTFLWFFLPMKWVFPHPNWGFKDKRTRDKGCCIFFLQTVILGYVNKTDLTFFFSAFMKQRKDERWKAARRKRDGEWHAAEVHSQTKTRDAAVQGRCPGASLFTQILNWSSLRQSLNLTSTNGLFWPSQVLQKKPVQMHIARCTKQCANDFQNY